MTPADSTARTPAFPPDDEAALVRRIVAGDLAAFERLMRANNRRLYRLARATLRDDAEAEDALQEAYLAAHRALAGFRGESSLATWLSRLVTNECLGRLRKRARRDNIFPIVALDAEADPEVAMDDARQPEPPDRALVRTQMRALLERQLDALPQAFRSVFVLRAVEELSVEETAQVLGIPEATVRTRHFRARSLLREALAQEIDLAERDLYEFGGAHCDRVVATVLAALRANP
ncbi:MAG: RNA polymerase sigma factor [Burkholderiaceae bacterium]